METYSQHGEDLVVAAIFGDFVGTYLDVGCGDPIKGSNTYLLYRKGWRGLCLDLLHDHEAAWHRERPRDHHVGGHAVTDRFSDTVSYWRCEADPALSTTIFNVCADRMAEGLRMDEGSTYTASVDHASYSWPVPDFVSIDVEGGEAAVLRGCPWDRPGWRPRVVCVESTRPRTAEPTWQSWEPILAGRGYRLHAETPVNRIYVAGDR